MRTGLTLLGVTGVGVGIACWFVWAGLDVDAPDVTTERVTSEAPITSSVVTPTVINELPPAPITVLAFGDTMFERFYATQDEADRFALIGTLETGLLGGADLVVLNLEGVIAPPAAPVKSFDFAFDDYYADLLALYQVDSVSLANNHSLDQGQAGYDRTVTELTRRDIGTFGHQTRIQAPVHTHRVDDQTIGLVGFNLTHPGASTTVARSVVEEAVANHDYTIVMMHWGDEYQLQPNTTQRTWGRLLVDWGADAVIGAHPHVMQGMEVYRGVPILWSLGNFAFDQYFSFETRHGLAAELTFSATSTSVVPIPVGAHKYTPRPLEPEVITERLNAFLERSELAPDLVVGTTTDRSLQIVIPRVD